MDIFNYFIVPTLGFISVLLMWINIDHTALKFGLMWAFVGIFYLAYITRGFKRPVPQHDEDLDDDE